MTPEDFRRHGRELIDWIADYMERVEEYPVQSQANPGDVLAALPDSPPDQGESFDQILADGNSTGDGSYWIDPDGTGAFQVSCDMTTDGGGWTAMIAM